MLKVSAELGAGLYDQAITTSQAAAAKNGRDWLPQYYLGQALTTTKRYGEAEAALEKARALASASDDTKRVWKQLGFVYQKQKKYDQAFAAYEKGGDAQMAEKVPGTARDREVQHRGRGRERANSRDGSRSQEARR